jgi:CXXX repeat radical SAM target protein
MPADESATRKERIAEMKRKSAKDLNRRGFLDAGAKALPVLAVLGLGIAAPARADDNCGCGGNCSGVCKGDCSGGCKDGCGTACGSDCEGACKGSCYGGCIGDCGGTCKDGCKSSSGN